MSLKMQSFFYDETGSILHVGNLSYLISISTFILFQCHHRHKYADQFRRRPRTPQSRTSEQRRQAEKTARKHHK
jgi:hypothetical protein